MKSVSKLLGWLLLALVAVLVAAAIAITQLFDPNDYKEEIRQLMRDKAQLELSLDGEIGWSLFPWLGLEVQDVQVARLQTPQQPFAKVRLLALSVRVLPLLRKEVQMSAVRVDGLSLSLQRDAKGVSNWEAMEEEVGKPAAGPDSSVVAADVEQQEPAGGAALKLDVNSLIVNSARVEFKDEQSGQQFTLENVQITTGHIREAADISLKLSGFLASNQPLLRARVELSALLNFALEQQLFQLKELRMAGELAGEPFADKSVNFTVRSNLSLDLAQQQAQVSNLRLSLNQLKAMAELTATDLDKAPQITGKLSLSEVNLKEFLPSIGVELPATANSKALTSFAMAADVQATDSAFTLSELKIKLDQTSFEGQLGSKNLAQGQLFVNLRGDQLDVDDYLPPAAKPEAGKTKTADTSAGAVVDPVDAPLPVLPGENPWSSEPLLPLAQLRELALDVRFAMQELKVKQLPLRDLRVQAGASKGVLTLQQLDASLFSGQISNSARLDAKTAKPVLELNSKVSDVPLEALVKALDVQVPVRGLFKLDTALRSSGNSERELVANLGGKGGFSVLDGQIEGINVDRYLCGAIAVLNRKSISNKIADKNTAFTAMRGSYTIDKGVLGNSDLSIAIPGLQNSGKGKLDVNVLGLDYALGVKLLGDTREMPDPACAINQRYVGLEFPLQCRGSLAVENGLSCRVDGDGLGKIVGRIAGDKLTDKLDEKLGEKVSPDLKDALKGLFK